MVMTNGRRSEKGYIPETDRDGMERAEQQLSYYMKFKLL